MWCELLEFGNIIVGLDWFSEESCNSNFEIGKL